MPQERKFTLWFDEIRIEDVPSVGGKNASLGEMYQDLTSKGVKIPNGFAYFGPDAGKIQNEIN